MATVLREGTSYIIAFALFAVCYVGANFISGFVWGFDAPYSTFGGVLRAVVETGVQMWFYVFAVSLIERLQIRHRAIPPLIFAVLIAGFMGVLYISSSNSGVAPASNGWEIAAAVVNAAAWLAFALAALARNK